jgi:hypothetical protein
VLGHPTAYTDEGRLLDAPEIHRPGCADGVGGQDPHCGSTSKIPGPVRARACVRLRFRRGEAEIAAEYKRIFPRTRTRAVFRRRARATAATPRVPARANVWGTSCADG